MFGHGFKIFLKDVFAKHAETFAELKIQPNQGISDLESKIAGHAKEAKINLLPWSVLKYLRLRIKKR